MKSFEKKNDRRKTVSKPEDYLYATGLKNWRKVETFRKLNPF